jgi:hypothetical protein
MADNKMKIGAMSACRVVECQKLSFNASCPTRGLTEVLPMTPNVAELKLFVGIGKLWVVEEVERLSPKLHTGARSGHRSATVLVTEQSGFSRMSHSIARDPGRPQRHFGNLYKWCSEHLETGPYQRQPETSLQMLHARINSVSERVGPACSGRSGTRRPGHA